MEKYRLYITSESGERETWTSGETVKECIDKLKDFHTFGEFEKEFFTKKGEDRLNKELNSGWYINLKNKYIWMYIERYGLVITQCVTYD